MEGQSQWIVIILMVLNSFVHIVLSACGENFIKKPTNPLIIPEGGSATVFCEHSGANGVNGIAWFKYSAILTPDDCSCSLRSISPNFLELNFTNFQSVYAGEYGCLGAIGAGNFDICTFKAQIGNTTAAPLMIISSQVGTMNMGYIMQCYIIVGMLALATYLAS